MDKNEIIIKTFTAIGKQIEANAPRGFEWHDTKPEKLKAGDVYITSTVVNGKKEPILIVYDEAKLIEVPLVHSKEILKHIVENNND